MRAVGLILGNSAPAFIRSSEREIGSSPAIGHFWLSLTETLTKTHPTLALTTLVPEGNPREQLSRILGKCRHAIATPTSLFLFCFCRILYRNPVSRVVCFRRDSRKPLNLALSYLIVSYLIEPTFWRSSKWGTEQCFKLSP